MEDNNKKVVKVVTTNTVVTTNVNKSNKTDTGAEHTLAEHLNKNQKYRKSNTGRYIIYGILFMLVVVLIYFIFEFGIKNTKRSVVKTTTNMADILDVDETSTSKKAVVTKVPTTDTTKKVNYIPAT